MDNKIQTTGGSIGASLGEKPKITNVGFNQDSRDKQGITRNTVVGDVEITRAEGSPINRDLGKANEITKDTHSSTNINVESQTIEYLTNPGKLKGDIGKAKDEIEAVGAVAKAAFNTIGSKEKNSFFDFLRTERVQETVRNLGYIDTKGKTKEQIAQEMQDKYGEIFAKNGKKLEINFYVNSEVSQDDPNGKNKMNSAGFVAEDGSIWLNADNISLISNFNLNSVFGHELTHNVTGKDTELLANFGEARASGFIEKAMDKGYLARTGGGLNWENGSLTEEQKQRLNSYTEENIQNRELTGDDRIDRQLLIDRRSGNAAYARQLVKAQKYIEIYNEMDKEQKENSRPRRQIRHRGRGKYKRQQEKGKQITAKAQKKIQEVDAEDKMARKLGILEAENDLLRNADPKTALDYYAHNGRRNLMISKLNPKGKKLGKALAQSTYVQDNYNYVYSGGERTGKIYRDSDIFKTKIDNLSLDIFKEQIQFGGRYKIFDGPQYITSVKTFDDLTKISKVMSNNGISVAMGEVYTYAKLQEKGNNPINIDLRGAMYTAGMTNSLANTMMAKSELGNISKLPDYRHIDEPPVLKDKLKYVFGEATGRKHNIDRSLGMASELSKIGINNTSFGKEVVKDHLIKTYNDSSSIISSKPWYNNYNGIFYNKTTRESFLKGVSGGVKIESTWWNNELKTIIIKSSE